ncbi:hypothetical protein P9112_005286 [Eukaryota sp. TZLM1-RC]
MTTDSSTLATSPTERGHILSPPGDDDWKAVPLPRNRYADELNDELSALTLYPSHQPEHYQFTIGSWNIGDRTSANVCKDIINSILEARPPQVLFIQEGPSLKHISKNIMNKPFFVNEKGLNGEQKRVMAGTWSSILVSSLFTIEERLDDFIDSPKYIEQTRVQRFHNIAEDEGVSLEPSVIGMLLDRSVIVRVRLMGTGQQFLLWNYHGQNRVSKSLRYVLNITLLKMIDLFAAAVDYPIILGGDFNIRILAPVDTSLFYEMKTEFEFLGNRYHCLEPGTGEVNLFDSLLLENCVLPLINDDYGRQEAIDFMMMFQKGQNTCKIADVERLRWNDQLYRNCFLTEDMVKLLNKGDVDEHLLNHPYVSGNIIVLT